MSGVYARHNGEWYEVSTTHDPDVIPGLGGWASLGAVSMQMDFPEMHTYTENGMEWASFTFTHDGSFTLREEGLVEL